MTEMKADKLKMLLLLVMLTMLLAGHRLPAQTRQAKPTQTAASEKANLVVNGDLEKGKQGMPIGWSGVDGLTVTWQAAGNPGKCLVFDTGVFQEDKKSWQTDAKNFPGRGQGRRAGQYDTVGAHEGVWSFATPIDLSPGDQHFIIGVDVKTPSKSGELAYPMVLIRGFQRVTARNAGQNSSWFHTHHPGGPAYSEMFGPDSLRRDSKEGDYLMVYRHTLACRTIKAGQWQRFEIGFSLPIDKPRFYPERILLKQYAFWPSGVYHFDNLTLRRSTAEEVKEVNRRRQSIKALE